MHSWTTARDAPCLAYGRLSQPVSSRFAETNSDSCFTSAYNAQHRLTTTITYNIFLMLQGGHPMFRNLPGARGNMGGYGRGMGPGGRVISGETAAAAAAAAAAVAAAPAADRSLPHDWYMSCLQDIMGA
jgi:hypothetical protein